MDDETFISEVEKCLESKNPRDELKILHSKVINNCLNEIKQIIEKL